MFAISTLNRPVSFLKLNTVWSYLFLDCVYWIAFLDSSINYLKKIKVIFKWSPTKFRKKQRNKHPRDAN